MLNLVPIVLPLLVTGLAFAFIWFRPFVATPFIGLGLIGVANFHATEVSALVVHTGRHIPFADEALLAADRILGFDWLEMLGLFDRYAVFFKAAERAHQDLTSRRWNP